MLDFRLIIGFYLLFLCSLQQASNVPFLKTGEVRNFTSGDGVYLIGYAGFPDCEYTKEFITQMEVAQNELVEQKVKVAIVNESVDGIEPKRGPFSMLYRKGHEQFRIDWLSDGHEIAKWIQLKLNAPVVHEFKNQVEYDYFVSQYKTVFAAFLTDQTDIDEYKKAADEINGLFLWTSNPRLASDVLKAVSQKIVVVHTWLGLDNVRGEYVHRFNKREIKKWAENQIYKTPKELIPRTAKAAFSSKTRHIAILFTPKSSPKFKETVEKFEFLHNFGENRNNDKFSLFYVDSEDSGNKPLLEKFGVQRNSEMIILFTTYNNLAQIPFTHQCSSSTKTPLEDGMLKFDTDMLKNYHSHLSNQQLID